MIQSAGAESGSRLLVRLPQGDKQPLLIVSLVRYCQMLADGVYAIGAEFAIEAEASAAQHVSMPADQVRADAAASAR